MKKLSILPLLILLAIPFLFVSHKSKAAGDISVSFTLTPSATSAAAGSPVTLAMSQITTSGGSHIPDVNEPVSVRILSGAGTISPASGTTDANGNATFYLSSSAAGTVTVQGCDDSQDTPCAFSTQSVSVTFTAPVTPAPVVHTSTPTSTTPAAPAPQAPAAVTASSVTVSGATQDTTKPLSVSSDKPLVLSGKTVPNGVVTLTIHSTPKTVTTTADKDGNWSYSVTGLPAGSHYVEASVKDPSTGLSSPTAKLLAFTVTAAKKPSAATTMVATKPENKSRAPLYLAGLLFLIILGAGVWLGWRRLSKNKQNEITLPPTPPADPGTPA